MLSDPLTLKTLPEREYLSGLYEAVKYGVICDRALFDVITSSFRAGTNRRLLKVPYHINDPAFADALVANFTEIRTPWPGLRARIS